MKFKAFVVACILAAVTLAAVTLTTLTLFAIYGTNGQHSINDEAVLIEGSGIVINWDASEKTWKQAHAKWVELKEAE